MARFDAREAVLSAADRMIPSAPRASLGSIAAAAGVSRATLYRYFPSRAALLAALELEPDPGSRDRVLSAAAELVGRAGLRNLSMDELAAMAGVSRATLYRLFSGKAALFSALLLAYSPFEPVERVLERLHDRPPDEVLPEVALTVARAAEPRIGILRSLMFEVTSGSPDALAGAAPVLRRLLEMLGAYFAGQIAVGRLRPVHPLLAAQALVGPIFFHLVTRPAATSLAAFDLPLEASVAVLAETTLRGLSAGPPGEDPR